MRLRAVAVVVLAAGSVVAACSGEDSDPTSGSDSVAESPAPTSTADPNAECGPSDPEVPSVEPVDDIEGDHTLTSFDGTEIRIHWYPAREVDGPAPTLLEGPGWGIAGATDTGGSGLFGDLSVGSLRDAGYNVLTWDPRGFGESSGTITVNDPAHEGRDVRRLLDWVATQPEVELDSPGDPRVGMLGGSYGGGIALVAAAIDCRIDAIAPTIAWHSLGTSLYRGEISKEGWGGLLYEAASGRELDPHVVSAHDSMLANGTISDEDAEWFESRGPGDALIGQITAPTLLLQGTVDTLFTPDEAIVNFRLLRDADVPVSMLWYCGGHGVCLSEPGDAAWTGTWTMHWFDRYLRNNESAPMPPTFGFVDQHGDLWAMKDYPETAATLVGSGVGTLELVSEGGAGPAIAPASGGGPLGGIALDFTPGRARNAVEVTISAATDGFVVGAPTVSLEYTGTVDDGDRPTRVFAQLVDDSNDLVLGNQITPIVVELDGARHTVEVELESVAHRLAAGETITLQLVATTTAYSQPRLGGSIEFRSIDVSLPVVDGVVALATR
jgi:ABC-2 type transport system ATP-binding protein